MALAEVEPVGLAELLDALPSLVAYVDHSETIRYVNRAARVWLGRAADDTVGRTVREVLGDAGYAGVSHHVHAALLGSHVSFERAMVLPRGDVVYALTEYVPHFREVQPDGFTVLVTDVTRQALAEAERADQQRQVEELVRRNRVVAGHTDDALQELFAISLHLERMRRLPDQAWAAADEVIDSVSDTIEVLRASIKHLSADLADEPSRGATPHHG